MTTFEKAFGRPRTPNTRKRTFSNLDRGLKTGYIVTYQLAVDEYRKGDYRSALELINKTIQLSDIDDWKHYAFKANALEDCQEYSEAIKNYERAIELAEDDVKVYALYHQIGYCNISLGNNQNAVKFYTYSLELKQQHPNNEYNEDLEGMDGGVLLGVPFKRIYNNRGNALKNLNQLNEAFEDCKMALSYDGQYSNTFLLLSQIFSMAGQEDKAIEMLEHSANLGNQNAMRILQNIRR
jgi:tetratricopeptide (TPR) repeat protein